MEGVNMLTTIEDISFIREIETAILDYCKEVHELTYVEHGENNIVALVNHEYVFRFPRDERSARRLVFETALLQKIKGKIDVVQIPELKQVHTAHLYTVATFIPGDHLTGPQIQTLSEDEQQAIGRKLASFTAQLNRAISGLELRRLRAEANVDGLSEAPVDRFRRVFEKSLLPNDKLRPVVNEYMPLWAESAAREQPNYAIHGNLCPSNLLFRGAELMGVVDLADTNTGSIEAEMRGLFEMGDIVLKSAADRYQELMNVSVATDHVRTWAIMYELATFTELLKAQQTEGPKFKRAQQRLQQWVPNFPL
jgi:aminoglycoside 2''-phosphotransferase